MKTGTLVNTILQKFLQNLSHTVPENFCKCNVENCSSRLQGVDILAKYWDRFEVNMEKFVSRKQLVLHYLTRILLQNLRLQKCNGW